MVLFFWSRPTPNDQNSCIERSGDFNYEAKHRGASAKPISWLRGDKSLREEGFFLSHTRVLVVSGINSYEKGKTALQSWRHFGLDWAFVDPKTPVEVGAKFCVCGKELFPWLAMPLEIVFVDEKKRAKKEALPSFSFGGGTLRGHLLAGEKRFSIELDEKDEVWYEVVSFSKPAHILSFRQLTPKTHCLFPILAFLCTHKITQIYSVQG